MHFKDFRTEQWKRSDFEAVGNNIYAWVLKAQELFASANILKVQCATRRFFPNALERYEDALTSEGGKVFDVILMLWGMAAECLLKALWLKYGGKLVNGGEYRKIPNASDHALEMLAEQVSAHAGVSFSGEEKELLYRLSAFIVLV